MPRFVAQNRFTLFVDENSQAGHGWTGNLRRTGRLAGVRLDQGLSPEHMQRRSLSRRWTLKHWRDQSFPFQDEYDMVFALERENLLQPILRLTRWTFEIDIQVAAGESGCGIFFDSDSIFRRTPITCEVDLANHLYPGKFAPIRNRWKISNIKCIVLYTSCRDEKTASVDQMSVLLIAKEPGTSGFYERIAPLDLIFFGDRVNPRVWGVVGGRPGPDFHVVNLKHEEIVLC